MTASNRTAQVADEQMRSKPTSPAKAGAAKTSTGAVTIDIKSPRKCGKRRIPIPGRGLHPSLLGHSFKSKPDDGSADCIERTRDRVLGFLAHPLLSAWTMLAVTQLLLVVVAGAMLVFLQFGAHNLCTPKSNCQPRNDVLNVSNQVLCALFTYAALLTLPWRLANLHHLTCSRRSCAAGVDFYGFGTESIWFHIPPFHRRAITLILLAGNTCLQFVNQAMRIRYSTYDDAGTSEGSLMVNVFFFTNLGFALIGAVYQLLQERRLRHTEPDKFPPGPLEDAALMYRKWRHGQWFLFPYFHRTKSIPPLGEPSSRMFDAAPAPAPAGAVARTSLAISKGIALVADLPWLVHDLVTDSNKEPPNPTDGPKISIQKGGIVPPPSDFPVYVALSISVDGGTKYEYVCRTKAQPCPRPQWDEVLQLGKQAESWPPKAKLKFLLLEEHTLGGARTTHFCGLVVAEWRELQTTPTCNGAHELLLQDIDGDPVLSGSPLRPCFLTLALGDKLFSRKPSIPYDGEGRRTIDDGRVYPKHVVMMSRGTRGDVQPFVALARGLCNELGWLVTICTEERWKDFVLSKCADVERGAVRFLCSGGDTQRQTETWISKEIMSSKTEALQELMMAASESNFFASAPVFMHHTRRLHRSVGVDLIINAFTLTGVALLCGEALGIPVAGFCLQPTCIPSDDADWHAIIPVDHGGLSLVEKAEEKLFTSHAALRPLRRVFNNWAFSALSLPSLRHQHGLESSTTWKAAFRWQLPIVIPMLPDAFDRPSDWPPAFESTDFIFLRSSAPGGGTLADDHVAFIDAARAKGRKLMVMTFSSMPVPRAAALGAAVEMLTKSKHDFALMYVGKRQPDEVPPAVAAAAAQLTKAGKLLESERADFGLLFREMDAFVVHGGLGTTVEALRMRKPTVVTGILLMDQRFWGLVCNQKGVGPAPRHIEPFREIAVDWADRALDPESDYSKAAAALDFGDEANDGVSANVAAFRRIVDAKTPPPRGHRASAEASTSETSAIPKNA